MSGEFKVLSVYANVQFPDNVSKYFLRVYIVKYVNGVYEVRFWIFTKQGTIMDYE